MEKVYLYYYEDENIFVDDDGHIVYDIFKYITPQNLYLFKKDQAVNLFPMLRSPRNYCEIVPIPVEARTMLESKDFDIGDDYERIERYEREKHSGYYNY